MESEIICWKKTGIASGTAKLQNPDFAPNLGFLLNLKCTWKKLGFAKKMLRKSKQQNLSNMVVVKKW